MTLALLAALVLDQLCGEPRRWHPLVGFGGVAKTLEARLNDGRRRSGVWALAIALATPAVCIAALLYGLASGALWLGWLAASLLAALAIGYRSLGDHIHAVRRPLVAGDIEAARAAVARVVSRDCLAMDAPAVRRAALESLLENAADAVFASMFWFAVGGLLAGPVGAGTAVVIHRLANTLDAMWGYRTPRLAAFGWAAARVDDALNWPVARLTALVFAVCGSPRTALACWRTQASACASPNAGPVMSAGAGALRVRLGGGALYHGAWTPRPTLGCGHAPTDADLDRGLALIARARLLWLVVIAVTAGVWGWAWA